MSDDVQRKFPNAVMPWGTYKGKKFSEVPTHVLKWIVDKKAPGHQAAKEAAGDELRVRKILFDKANEAHEKRKRAAAGDKED
ncbi:MAG: DUF3820 family protein [Reyranella sp.]|uniref:putative quorum-sensing-regulated virulence factor n=1 Tax=Reyranella sp. TaxID=1929291 RepID=UPI003D09711E